MSCTCQNRISRICLRLLVPERRDSPVCLALDAFPRMHTWISSLLICRPCVSDLLAGEEKKACDEVFLESRHYHEAELVLMAPLHII